MQAKRVECTACHKELPPRSRFCNYCGAPTEHKCPQCGSTPPSGSRFCNACGYDLTSVVSNSGFTSTDQNIEPTAVSAPDPERRHLTVMFCDLVDSTKLAEGLDPEDLRSVVCSYQEICTAVVERYQGHIAQYLGDGLLIYFGYPHAHDNDTERALRAGLEILQELELLNVRLESEGSSPLAVRIGIHTGNVVVGEMGGGDKRETLALGDATHLAARLQALAPPDSVVISEATRRLTQGFFLTTELGEYSVKGFTQPIIAYQVIRPTGISSRLDVAAASGLTPLVGREQEIGLLLDRWKQGGEEVGQIVFISGEAGIGKSRLIQMFKERLLESPHTWFEVRCATYTQNSPLYPVVDLLQQALAFLPDDNKERKLGRLERALDNAGFDLAETVPLFASLLSLPLSGRYQAPSGSPERQRRQTMHALIKWLFNLSKLQPLVLVVEDLHWADPSSMQLLEQLYRQVPTAGMLMLLTYRQEFEPPWTMRSHTTPIVMSRLNRRQVAEMIESIAGPEKLSEQTVQAIISKTDGVPLFVEELTRSVLESEIFQNQKKSLKEGKAFTNFEIPETLQDSLRARLDSLSPVKRVIELCATLGREFSYTLLEAISPMDESELQHGLIRLVEAELLYQRGLPPSSTYIFKHALIQEVAYQSLLKSRRRQFHQQIAEVLIDRFPEAVETQPELIAHHYTQAKLYEPAISYWQKAGKRALERSANIEAVSHLTNGLDAIDKLPESPSRKGEELKLLTSLGTALVATRGYQAPEVEATFARARRLCQQLGNAPQLFPVQYGLWFFYLMKAERDKARETADQLMRLAQEGSDEALLVDSHNVVGVTAFFGGHHSDARAHFEKSLEHYDAQKHRARVYAYGRDGGVMSEIYGGWNLWFLGYADQALKRTTQAIELAKQLGHLHTIVGTLLIGALANVLRRDAEATLKLGNEGTALAKEHGFTMWEQHGTTIHAAGLLLTGEIEEAIGEFRRAEAIRESTGIRMLCPNARAALGEACLQAGRPEEALKELEYGMTLIQDNVDRYHEPELYRLMGEVRIALSSSVEAAEDRFNRAIDIARTHNAKAFELRAVTSLGKLWQGQGRRSEAKELVSRVYDQFTEGFDTADLVDARALIDDLS